MLKIIIKITLSLFLLISSFIVKAQEFQGKAVYQTKMKMDDAFKKRIDSSKMPDDRKAFMMKMIKKRMEKVYELNFTKTTSIYKEQKSLEAPSENDRFNRSSNNLYFKDIKNKKFISKKETFGKVFLIKDALTNYEWKLEKETKMIGNHLCLKATAEAVLNNNGNRFSRFSKNSNDKKTAETEIPKKTKITAWYTPEIPVSNGPESYEGLPGLILQLDAGNMQILCTKIILNPKEKADIVAPTKGKEVSQKEYEKITKEKLQEMKKLYKNNRKKGGSSRRHGRF